MKRNNKKGFTIVELVIVIAVIAILSAVLIPTFGSVISDANKTAAQQEARNAYTSYIQANKSNSTNLDKDLVIVVDGAYYFTVVDGQLLYTSTAHANSNDSVYTSGNAVFHTLTKCAANTTCESCYPTAD